MTNPTPAITFQVDFKLQMNEKIGPIENEKDVAVLHPDRYQEDQDNAILENANRVNLVGSHLPTMNLGNRKLKHGDTFTEYGQKAVYLRDMYGVGYAPSDRAYLKVVSIA
jgi:hypothetical protein